MTKICTFVLVEIFKIEVAQLTDIVSKGRNKKRKKNKTKQNKKNKKKKRRKIQWKEGGWENKREFTRLRNIRSKSIRWIVSLWDKIDTEVLIKAFCPKLQVFNSQSRCWFHFHVLLFLDEQFFSINAFLSPRYRIIYRKRNFYRVSDKKRKTTKKSAFKSKSTFLIIVSENETYQLILLLDND